VKREIELLAPGGDIDSIKAAIVAGADAVYCGINKFNARNRATNINFVDLPGILLLAHAHKCQVFLTLNIIVTDSEIPDLIHLLNKLVNTNIDGVIVQDLGMLYLLSGYFPGLKIHASTQLTTHNEGQLKFLAKLAATRVNLSRELNLVEIASLTAVAHDVNILTEVFVHGSFCISFSGICYMSSVHGGNSGNRGRCSQPCRAKYATTPAGKDYPLNLKDNSAYFDVKELADAGVDSLKIEGRIKEFEYVHTVVSAWRKQLRRFFNHEPLSADNSELHMVFNRSFTNSYLKGDINKDMFIDNPMSNSTKYYLDKHSYTSEESIVDGQRELHEEKTETREAIKAELDHMSIEKTPIDIYISGEPGSPLKVKGAGKDVSFEFLSRVKLESEGAEVLNRKILLKRFIAINDTAYYIRELNLDQLQDDVYIKFSELSALKRRILFMLNGSVEAISPITLPVLKRKKADAIQPGLSVIISSPNDIHLSEDAAVRCYYQLPAGLKHENAELIDLFVNNRRLIPWFPSVLIGEDFDAARVFLQKVQPELIVTNNSGVGYEAYKMEIPWIAGPQMNIINSYSILSLKEELNCSGAFISNEINQFQISRIHCPEDFRLYYSIYHPIELMSSRQCFFYQVTGCEKERVEESCIQHCDKAASIKNLQNITFHLSKTKGNYNSLYNDSKFLNIEIINDLRGMFSGFSIDVRDIETGMQTEANKSRIISLFKQMLEGDSSAGEELKQNLHPTTSTQYDLGI
jgi:U32 family peptidase